MVQERGTTNGPRAYDTYIAPHPGLRKDGVDVDNFCNEHQLYTREYLNSVHHKHHQPTKLHHLLAWYWHLVARSVVSIATGSWLAQGADPPERCMVGRMLTFTSVGVAGSAAQATVLHFRAVLFNVSDNGWCHTFISLAENFRMHGGMVAIATRPPFLARVIALMVQVVVYFQMLAVYMVAPSVANAYLSYLAEEQVANLSRTMDMIDRGRAPWLSSLPAPALARSYYGLGMGREGATMREVFLRMRADSACNQHMTLVFSELCPAERNPFIVAADIKAQ